MSALGGERTLVRSPILLRPTEQREHENQCAQAHGIEPNESKRVSRFSPRHDLTDEFYLQKWREEQAADQHHPRSKTPGGCGLPKFPRDEPPYGGEFDSCDSGQEKNVHVTSLGQP